MEKDYYQLTTNQLEKEATNAVNVFIVYMNNQNIIDADTANNLLMNTAILIRRPSFFTSLWNKYYSNKDENPHYIVVEQKTLEEDEKKNNVVPIKKD